MRARWRPRPSFVWGAALVVLATVARLVWVLSVPTVPVSDFAMYRESANYLSEMGHLDPGFIYMPGFVALLAWVKDAGGDLVAQKMLGVIFGGIGAAGLYALTCGVVDDAPERAGGAPGRWRRFCPAPYATVATAIYALWPAGVAISSVVGTDMPAAALLVAALGLLVTLAPRRPMAAAMAFGFTMGLAAWMRAVALPLSALAFGYWLARREGLTKAMARTGVGVAATLLVLSPWAFRHLRQSGHFYFADDHGGITALIGANPNSEGTYTRALNALFKDVTGRGVLDEPHRETDAAAYALAREWFRAEPRYALGLVALKAERLYDPESRLLYWSILRPGVLVGSKAGFFAAHHDGIADFADAFGLLVAGLAIAGVAVAAVRRRWKLLSLLPFQLALTATYALFFAEPRYRLPIEMLAFPFVALVLGELAAVVSVLRAWSSRSTKKRTLTGSFRSPATTVRLRAAALGIGPALLAVLVWRLGWPAAADVGAALRARHRWAVTELAVGDRVRTLAWTPAPPFVAASPIAGAPNGVHLAVAPEAPTRVTLEVGPGPLAAGHYRLGIRLEATGALVRVALTGAPSVAQTRLEVDPGAPATLDLFLSHPGGRFALEGALTTGAPASVWASAATLRRDP